MLSTEFRSHTLWKPQARSFNFTYIKKLFFHLKTTRSGWIFSQANVDPVKYMHFNPYLFALLAVSAGQAATAEEARQKIRVANWISVVGIVLGVIAYILRFTVLS